MQNGVVHEVILGAKAYGLNDKDRSKSDIGSNKHNPAKPRRVAIWVPENGQLIGVIGVLEAFEAANRIREHIGKPLLYRVEVIGPSTQSRSATGVTLATRPASKVRNIDTLVVGGSLDDVEVDANVAAEACRDLARLARTAGRVVGICSGTFWLGAIGLLDGRRCTTHWIAAARLAERFPEASVEPGDLYVEDRGLFTSAGATAGIDLALHLIRRDGGAKLSLAVARALVVFAQRSGGQSQFSASAELPAATSDRIQSALERIVTHPAKDHSVETMAKRAGMSTRHFARIFRAQTGTTPAAFVMRARVEAAQRLLTTSDRGLEWVASRSGFGSVESLRRGLVRIAGVGPAEYRRRFSSQ